MSREKPPQEKEASSLQSTRQMLDELDELMERMLSLPVQEVEESAAAPREIVRMPTVSATLTVLDSPPEEDEREPAPREPNFRPRSAPKEFPNYTADLDPPPVRVKVPGPEPIPEEAIPPRVTDLPLPSPPAAVPFKPIKVRRRSIASLCLLPLLWANRGYDRATLFLGEPGRWLRSAGGRQIVGLAGLLLLALAMGWLLKDWLGWTW